LEAVLESFPIKMAYSTAFAPDAILNYAKKGDPELDALYARASAAEDPAPLWKAMSRRITDQALLVPVFHGKAIYFVKGVDGVVLSTAVNRPIATQWSPK
jgi:ABC-type transport system substrate-binding protein